MHKSSKVNSIAPSHDSYRREVVLLALGNTHASLTVSWHTQTPPFLFLEKKKGKKRRENLPVPRFHQRTKIRWLISQSPDNIHIILGQTPTHLTATLRRKHEQ